MSTIKTEKVVLLGKSGSGKDYLMRKLAEKSLKSGLKTTTRPKRKFESQGITYDFISENIFKDKLNNNEFLVYQEFKVTPEGRDPETWYYGLTKEEFNNSQLFIMTPNEFSTIDKERRKGCFVVYLDIDRDVREKRISGRGDKNDSVKRRLDADEIDFADFSKNGDYDLRVTDPDFNADDIYDLMA
jgi:guanylate kinase